MRSIILIKKREVEERMSEEWEKRMVRKLNWSLVFCIGMANVIMSLLYFVAGWDLLGFISLIGGSIVAIIGRIKEKCVYKR